MAIPDHLGPRAPTGAAKLGGQITLDGIRAARRFDALGLSASPVGGAPMNIDKMAEALGQHKNPAFGLATAAALGLEHQYLRPYADHESAQYRRAAAA